MTYVENVTCQGELLAVILRHDFVQEGIHFFTPNNFSQQLAYMKRPVGYAIPPHVHNPVSRDVSLTQEVLFLKTGRVRVDFYDQGRVYLESRELKQGDVILLAHGGHGFTMLEESEIIEVKQGPYVGEQDKTRFPGVRADQVRLHNDR
ncbi:MAG: hypothetical protein HQL21_09655 [Candidatus Omnitrophica bacterium]|nr:hypothetical protein [Candidatus Omnitrophota bacterium]